MRRPPKWCIVFLTMLWLLLAVTTIAALRPPIVRIDQELTSHIHPGMTVAEITQVIGVPPGRYDGVTYFQSESPMFKRTHEWVDSIGHLQILEGSWRGTVIYWHPVRNCSRNYCAWLWERLSGHPVASLATEMGATIAMATLGVVFAMAGLVVLCVLGIPGEWGSIIARDVCRIAAGCSLVLLTIGILTPAPSWTSRILPLLAGVAATLFWLGVARVLEVPTSTRATDASPTLGPPRSRSLWRQPLPRWFVLPLLSVLIGIGMFVVALGFVE